MKKILMVFFAVLLLVVSSASASLAYFTDNQSTVGTFTVGQVGISLEEYIGNSAIPSTGDIKIERIVPGQSYEIRPVISVDEDGENCYLFVKVKNELADIESCTDTIASQMAENKWVLFDNEKGLYYFEEEATAGDEIEVFDHFSVDGASVDSKKLKTFDNKIISVTVYAVQSAGFETAADAWNAAVDAGNIAP